jgi:hypothetical protein
MSYTFVEKVPSVDFLGAQKQPLHAQYAETA